MAQPVVALADVAQFVDQVKKREQAEERQQHQQRGGIDFARQVLAQDPHRANDRNSECTASRRQNSSTSSEAIATWTSHQPV